MKSHILRLFVEFPSVTNAAGVLTTAPPNGVVTSPLSLDVANISGVGHKAVITFNISSTDYNDFTAVLTVETADKTPVGFTDLTASDITATGATRGILTDTGNIRTLAISNITVANGENVTVTIANPSGYAITPSSRNVAVNVATTQPTTRTVTFNLNGGNINGDTSNVVMQNVPENTGVTPPI